MWGWNPVGRDCVGPYSFANRCDGTDARDRFYIPSRFHRYSDSQRYARAGSIAGSGSDTRACPNAYSYRHAHPGCDTRAYPKACAHRHARSGSDCCPYANVYSYLAARRGSDTRAYPKAYVHPHAHPGTYGNEDTHSYPTNLLARRQRSSDAALLYPGH